ncbi:MAG: helicase-exonuclease AddAB subunit AddA [Planctomycetes bacterium]|nr:helicase-exonuclease AddAB subunit AddA [Planctomycetota bacterium]
MSEPVSETVQWTEGQKRAIAWRGSDVLVAASAGTGKTAVLSSRCLSLLSESQGQTGILNMLILTFTEAAAAEMSLRIRRQLTVQAQKDPRYRHLQREVLLLPSADISTIHAFCKRLITDHFHLLGLDPSFRLIDSDEQCLLKSEALEETLEWAWREPSLAEALPELFYQRNLQGPTGFASGIIGIHDFLEGQVSPQRWCERALALARAADLPDSDYANAQWRSVQDRLAGAGAKLERAQILFRLHGGTGTLSAESLLVWVEEMQGRLKRRAFDGCVEALLSFKKPRVTKPKGCDEEWARQIQALIKRAVDEISGLRDWAVLCPDYRDRMAEPVLRQTETLLGLARQFSRHYRRLKQRSNCLDFADLEHLALKLLVEPDPPDQTDPPDGNGRKGTDIALALRRQYHHIFVDEYQDINAVQETLIGALARGDNLFAVGDVKQSIYAFRGAQPQLFLARLAQAEPSPERGQGQALRVDLNTNFRSTPGILACVNHLFARLMSVESAGMAYDAGARFTVPPAAAAEGTDATCGPALEFHLLEDLPAGPAEGPAEASSEAAWSVSSRQRQAALVARRIRQMMGLEEGESAYQVLDKARGCRRDLRFGDIAILMRSPAKRVDDYLKFLRLAGVPVSCPGASGYFEATEIGEMLSLLKVLDNPQRDIEFVSVLRGSLGAVTDTELAEIVLLGRTRQKRLAFSEQVEWYCEKGPDRRLATKLRNLVQQLDRWRQAAREGALADLIWDVLSDGGLLALVQALPGAELRRANLLKFHDRAIQFSGFASSRGAPSLRRFVEFIEQLQAAGADWSSAEPPALERDAVQITSVHRSKGLEFPVVILAELNSPFSSKDSTDDLLLSADQGLGLQVVEKQTGLRLPSLAHQVIAQERRAVALAEEMRVLYVALTRARDRLILTGSCKAQEVRDLLGTLDVTAACVDLDLLRSSRCLMQWLIAGFADQRALWEAVGLEATDQSLTGELIDAHYYDPAKLSLLARWMRTVEAGQDPPCAEAGEVKADALLESLKKSLHWEYPHAASTRMAAKRTVSQLLHAAEGGEKTEPYRPTEFSFAEDHDGKLRQQAIGTGTHWVLSRISLEAPVTRAGVDRLIEGDVESGALAAETAGLIEVEPILNFFAGPLGELALDSGNRVLREWPFTVRIAVGDGDPHATQTTDNDSQIVQGIADMVVLTDQGAQVIDFKTDRVTVEQIQERASFYRDQLVLYGRAVEKCLECPVRGLWLYFLAVGRAVEIVP